MRCCVFWFSFICMIIFRIINGLNRNDHYQPDFDFFYSIGVWSENLFGTRKSWHLGFFELGLIRDTGGTNAMFDFARGMAFDIHGVFVLLGFILMLIHAVWALSVL